jgi:hypothetical protein
LLTRAIDIEIQGMVIEVGGSSGIVTIMGVVVSKLRKIQIALTSSDYNIAGLAYHKRLPVRCNGDLIKEEKKLLLKNYRNFRLDPV